MSGGRTEGQILAELRTATETRPDWQTFRDPLGDATVGVHLAVMLEPFLTYLLRGRKTIESRFARHAIAPYERVQAGDLVFLKSGPVLGVCRVAAVTFESLTDGRLDLLRELYSRDLCADSEEFWNSRSDKRYATLMWMEQVRMISPVKVPKRDMRGWVVLRDGHAAPKIEQLSLL